MKMLRYSLLLCLLLAVGPLAAQPVPVPAPVKLPLEKSVKPRSWGIEGGLDLSHFSASRELISAENRTGWFIGLKIKTKIPLPNLGLDAALLYDQNDFSYEQETDLREKKLHMFQAPVNLRYNWTIVPSFVLYLATGPQWNWIVDRERIGQVGHLEHTFFDWNIGMGLELLRHVQFGFNYNIPMGKMGEINNVNLEGHTWNVRLAYYF